MKECTSAKLECSAFSASTIIKIQQNTHIKKNPKPFLKTRQDCLASVHVCMKQRQEQELFFERYQPLTSECGAITELTLVAEKD